ncbi:peptidoglycan-binding protein [Streptomyces sp. FXJ1.172]|uniref:peptidoglycan-binding domain-containing protein n=1 Tax=Streptomyces sp. FXJ1.172 TaxID=710705 RepID=UPI0007CF40BF|nr:peptidoglycan-binding protein [Streptomyces sp. FXJ1.172]WEO99723.1 peptidoglycan-binding protein [Streptomyces sp. FXJ1.172]
MGRGSAARAALCVLVLAVVCAGAAGPRAHRSDDRSDGVLLAGGLPAAQQLVAGGTRRSDLIGLWQSMLWADGYTARSGVTCTYDDATAGATRVWQSNHHLSADGIVGAATWGAAEERIAHAGSWVVYQGERFALPLRLDEGGAYEVYDAGRFHRLRTDAVTLTRCR